MSAPAAAGIGTPLTRVEGDVKVRGEAYYAVEYPVEGTAYGQPVVSRVAKGRIASLNDEEVRAVPGVVAVLWHENAPRLGELDDAELRIFQNDRVAYRGQLVAIVVADSLEAAREGERLLRIGYEAEEHDVVLRADHPRLYKPPQVNPTFATDTEAGDFDAAFAAAEVQVDETYQTPAEHNNPMEPHSTLAVWEGDGVTVYDSNQGVTPVRDTVAKAFELPPERVRVIAPHVGGGFGSKGTPRPQVIAAVMASRLTGRPVKIAVPRQQMFAYVGYRTPTIQRMRLGAGRDGRLTAIAHEVVEQTSTLREFAEQTAVLTRMLYAGANRRTSHRLAPLDVPTPSWMRAPGECPGSFALECALDELALACGIDPVEIRILNEPEVDPESGRPFSSRNLVACLRTGADRFGWWERDPRPGATRDGRWLVGMGVATATYPARRRPSRARARENEDGTFTVALAAADIGTGARTALTLVAADALGVDPERVRLELGDSSLPDAPLAGGSAGTNSWGSAVVKACRRLRESGEQEVVVDTTEDVEADDDLSKHGFGAHFVEVRVDTSSGEARVSRALGVFATGRIVNPVTARSQFIGGMTMGISMALYEESVLDPRFGDWVNHDLAGYHVATCADVPELEATWVEEDDDHLNPMGTKGIGEIGIVGAAAAVANAVHHATGIRVRDLPIRLDKLLEHLTSHENRSPSSRA
jgi:xanthine dehydrogenase YagR molybdenum-binding subunit